MSIALGAAVVFLASFLGGAVGFAYGLVALPLLLTLDYPLGQVVAANLIIALTGRILVVAVRWGDISWKRVLRMLLGVAPGTLVGLWVIARISRHILELAAGVVVLLAVAILVVRGRDRPDTESPSSGGAEIVAGGLGGFLGSTTSLNGLPLAIMLTGHRVRAKRMVADLAAYFVIGNLVTLALLAWGGALPIGDIVLELAVWIPAGLAGAWVGVHVGPRLPHLAFRRLTLIIIVASAVASLARGLLPG